MGRRTVILMAAFVIAGIGAALIFVYVQGVDQRAQAGTEMVEVLTVTAPLAAGETVSAAEEAGKFALAEIPSSSMLDGALTDTSTLADMVAVAPLYTGEQVVAAKFDQVGSQSRITIPNKMMAISIQLSDPQRVAGFVSPGSRVAVFSTTGSDTGDATQEPATRVLIPDVQVIGVGQTGITATTKTDEEGAETTEQVPQTILTLALRQGDAERVILASGQSSLAFGLLTESSMVTPSEGVAIGDLYAGSGRP